MSLPIEPIDISNMDTHPPPPHDMLLPHEFVIDITSPKGSGKTTLLIRYLEHYKNYFHRIYIFSPTVSNDPKWGYLFDQKNLVASNKWLEKWLKENGHEDLLKQREEPIHQPFKEKTEEDEQPEQPKSDHPTSLRGLPIRLSKKKTQLPTQSSLIIRGAHRVLETPKGLFMNQNPNSMVVGYPNPPELRRVTAIARNGASQIIQKLRNTYYSKHHGTLQIPKLPKDENVREKAKEQDKMQVDSEESEEDDNDIKPLYPKGKLSQKIVCSTSDSRVFQKICDRQQQIIDKLEKKFGNKKAKFKADRILFLLDDVVGTELFKENGYFMKWITRHRHFSASVIFITQAFRKVPPTIRTNINALILYRMHSERELQCIYEEYPLCFDSFKKWLAFYYEITKEPYSFMYINLNEPTGKQVYKNFETMIPTNSSRELPAEFMEIDTLTSTKPDE